MQLGTFINWVRCDKHPMRHPDLAWMEEHYPRQYQHPARQVALIIVEQLGVNFSQIRPETRFIEDLGVGDLDDVELIMAIEEEFHISISEDDCANISSLGELIDCLVLLPSTKTPAVKFQMLRNGIISMLEWGASNQEILIWLENDHAIFGEEARSAMRMKVRRKAISTLFCSGFGIFLAWGIYNSQLNAGLFETWAFPVVIIGVGCASTLIFLRSAACLIVGRPFGSVN